MNPYHQFHLELLQQTYNELLAHYPFTLADLPLQEQEFLNNFVALIDQFEHATDDYMQSGQTFCLTWIRAYPDLTPILPRDLLWFFSGECLHYMPDEEISQFQQLDELRYEAECAAQTFKYAEQRALLFGLTAPADATNKIH